MAIPNSTILDRHFVTTLKPCKLYELAGETQDFISDTEERDFNKNELSALEIELEIWDVDKARVQVTATSSQGETIGNTSEI